MSQPVFRYVKVSVSPVSYLNTIEWRLSPLYSIKTNSLNFYVEVAHAGQDWTRLTSSPLVNTCIYTDTNADYRYSIIQDLYYRVVLVDGSDTYYSPPTDIGGSLSDRERRIVYEVMRRKYIQMVKSSGVYGYVCIAKNYGTACSCLDTDLNTVPTPYCPLCFGTGITGGYFDPIPMYMEFLDSTPVKRDEAGVNGVELYFMRKALFVPFPSVYPDDIWIDGYTGDRYKFDSEIKREVYIRNTPIIESATLKLLPYTDSIYSYPFPVSATTASSAWSPISVI